MAVTQLWPVSHATLEFHMVVKFRACSRQPTPLHGIVQTEVLQHQIGIIGGGLAASKIRLSPMPISIQAAVGITRERERPGNEIDSSVVEK